MAPLGVTVSVVAQSTHYYPTRPGNGQYWAQEVAADNSTNSLTVAATVKHNGVTVETQQLRYRRAQEALQWDAVSSKLTPAWAVPEMGRSTARPPDASRGRTPGSGTRASAWTACA